MTVYVDDMRAPYGRMIMCHMIADTVAELHAMADAIGVARRWHQGDHYDISLTKRAKAVALGAQEITWRDCSLMMVARRHDLRAPLLTPDQGRAWLTERMAMAKRGANA